VTKSIIRHSNRRDFLLPYKFGVEPVVRAVAVERALDRTLDRSYTQLTSLDFSYACNTVDRRDIAEGLRQHAPVLKRAGRGAYSCTFNLVLSSSEGEIHRHLGPVVRQGDPIGPLMFSLGINSLLRDLTSTFGQTDPFWLTSKASILSPDDLALEQTLYSFDERRPFIRLSPAKCNCC
jgi:hypothetical protein